jgi:phospholipase/carboxylesterase
MTHSDAALAGTTVPTQWNPVALWSRPEEERDGTPLLVLLHGHLASEQDLMGVVEHLPEDFTVASLRAPLGQGAGFTWFPLTQDLDYSVEKAVDAVGQVGQWLDTVKARHSSVSLLGFSMGMAVASSLMRNRPEEFAAVVGLSGFVLPSDGHPFFRDQDAAARRTPFFWGRDQEDPVISPDKIEFTHAWLNAHTDLTKVLYANMWHSISVQELGHVREFLTHRVLRAA